MHETRRTSRESEPTAPALSVNFDAIKSKPERNPRLEEFHDIFGSAGQRQRFFEGARETFRFMFRPDEVHNHLEAAPRPAPNASKRVGTWNLQKLRLL